MSRILAFGIFWLTPSIALATTPWNIGCGAPAPEIGAGVVGTILAVGTVKYFRSLRKSR